MSKEITKEMAESMCYKWDAEGPWYAVDEGYFEDLMGTEHESKLLAAKESMGELEDLLSSFKEKWDIADS